MSSITRPQKLTARQQTVLFAIIAEYVASGRPVSSKTLTHSHDLGMSAATIRREMNELTKLGFLAQPHVSAGRVPTDRAFRSFADLLKTESGQIDEATREKLTKGLSGLLPGGPRSWQDVVKLLSDISYQAALIVTPALADAVLRQLRFIPCGSTSLLAVVVTREGLVHNAYVETPKSLTDRDLERIHNYLGEIIEGRTLNDVRRILREELNDARTRCDELREQATVLGTKAIQIGVKHTSDLLIDGRSHLLAQPELKDRMEELLLFLEEKKRILALLDRAAETDRGPIVIIGEEAGDKLEGCAIITSPFGDETNKGQVGIIGSARMNFSALIPMVALAAQFLSTRVIDIE